MWRATDTVLGATQQDSLTMSANSTFQTKGKTAQAAYNHVHDILYWSPSRQIVSNISTDLQIVRWMSQGYSKKQIQFSESKYNYLADPFDTYVEYNKSLELDIHRNGPILGTAVTSKTSRGVKSFLYVYTFADPFTCLS